MKSMLRFAIAVLGCILVSGFNSIYSNETFKSLTIENGLAHSDANCISQDSTGLMWIGTYAGLQSYDGYALRTFDYYLEGHKIYQSHNRINAVVSSIDKLWIGTESGLTCFDLKTHRYIPYYIGNKNTYYRPDSFVSQLFLQSSDRHLWIKYQDGFSVAEVRNDTLFLLDWENKKEMELGKYASNFQVQGENVWASVGTEVICMGFRDGKPCVLNRYKISDLLNTETRIHAIFCSERYLYLRSAGGCYRIPFDKGKLKTSVVAYIDFHALDSDIPESTSGKFVVHKDSILCCTYWGGLFEIQQPFSQFPLVHNYLENIQGGDLSKQKNTGLLIDKYDNLWVTMQSWGVLYRSLSDYSFKNVSRQDFQKLGFLRNEINALVGLSDHTLWMLVESGSLFRYDLKTEQLSFIPITGVNTESRFLQTIAASKDQRHLYIGTDHGAIIYDTQTGIYRELKLSSASNNVSVSKLEEDRQGRLWIGMWGDGLICVEHPLATPSKVAHFGMQTEYPILSDKLTDLKIYGNSVYICTTNGLNKINLSDSGEIKGVSSYQTDSSSDVSMSTNYLADIDCQSDSVCWLGTIGGGLNKLVIHSDKPNDYTATCYTTRNGLTGNDCEIVFIDHTGNVWMGGNGITRLDTENDRIYTYGSTNGLQNNAFKLGAGFKGADGTLYMGGLYGLSYFHPSRMMQSVDPLELIFTDLEVNNEKVIPQKVYNDRVVLKLVPNETSELSLTYKQNNFALSFAALGYGLSEQVMYRYRLKGFQDNWQTLRYTNNQVFYSNLPYGTYELDVQLSNDKGYTWQAPGRSMHITVVPPWWLTIWAKIFYILFAMGIIFWALYQYNKEQKLKRENEIQKIIIVKDEEKYQTKMQFFMNASHELKTPLTLILLSAEQLLAQSTFAKECKSIFFNTKKMLALITELMDIRKVDLGINTLNLTTVNVSQLSRQLFDEISPWAKKKNISISYLPTEKEIVMDADKDKMGKLIVNLFTNAIKYTSEGGSVEISLKEGYLKEVTPLYATIHVEGKINPDQLACILTVKDTGVGISQESIRLIYERFFQVKEEDRSHLGSGIGLAIAKGVVLQHNGSIIVSSQRMVGTEFIVALPVLHEHSVAKDTDDEAFNARGFIEGQYNELIPGEHLLLKEETEVNTGQTVNSDLPTLLIVEDNKELQVALKEHFSTGYHILVADNGRIGLEICETCYPDIIISDVMMPEMDGIEMCRRIKDNLSVAYIPIVMLTAKTNVESQIEGYESGADLYLPKPFSLKLLEVNLRRLLAQREQWFKGNKAPVSIKAEVKQFSAADRKFEERLKEVIEQNIDNPEFSVESLLSPMGMSRTKLYSRMKEVCDQPLSDYIRNIRLEKAACLLSESDLTITEVMDESGFVNNSHFSKVFRLKYGVTPTEYKKRG